MDSIGHERAKSTKGIEAYGTNKSTNGEVAGKFSTTLGSNVGDWSSSHFTFGSWLEIVKW